jgi:hypothetical protein
MLQVAQMSGALRGLLLGSIAVAYVVLLVHLREPFRLDVGDPPSEAATISRIRETRAAGLRAALSPSAAARSEIDNPPLPRIAWGGIGELVGDHIGTLRWFALVFSALASWLMFLYASALCDRRVGLIATTVFSTSLLWLEHADSIHQAPLVQCAGFLALWGTVRAIETKQLRHYLAVGFGAFACLLASYDYYLVLPVGVLSTIYYKTSAIHPHRSVVAVCAVACGAAIGATCLLGHVPHLVGDYDGDVMSMLPAIARRLTLYFTPFIWIAVGCHVLGAIRAKTMADAAKHLPVWLLLAGTISLLWLSPHAASRPIALQALLPFCAIGSAVLIVRYLDRGRRARTLAIVWLALAPLWSLYWMLTQRRVLLDPDEVAEASTYLTSADTNDFVISNLPDDLVLETSVERHTVDAREIRGAADMLRLFELTGADAIHVIMFSDPSSRLVESSLSAIVGSRPVWSVLGWPQIARRKSESVIQDYDQKLLTIFKAAGATKVLQLRHLSIYRIERSATRTILERDVPVTRHIDFDTADAGPHELLGWDPLRWSYESPPGITVDGFWRCRDKRCKTIPSERGLLVPAADWARVGQVMVRLERVCDLRLTVAFSSPSEVRLAAGTFSSPKLSGNPVTVTIPAEALATGVNILELENVAPGSIGVRLRVSSMDLSPACASP